MVRDAETGAREGVAVASDVILHCGAKRTLSLLTEMMGGARVSEAQHGVGCESHDAFVQGSEGAAESDVVGGEDCGGCGG